MAEQRLTAKHYDGKGYYMRCSERCRRTDCEDCEELDKLVDRLGELEDERASAGDAVPVVRCKDCRRFSKSGYEEANQYEEDLSLHMGYCSEWKKGIQGCRFCSYGERGEGE